MQNLKTGEMEPLEAEKFGMFKRIFAAGKMDAPIFSVGDEIDIRNGRFRVIAVDRRLVVLEGIPSSITSNVTTVEGCQHPAARRDEGSDAVQKEG